MSSRKSSKLVYALDPGTEVKSGEIWAEGAAEKTYQANGFKPATEDTKLSYTPGRVAKNLFNSYSATKQQVCAYYTDFSHYDSRYGEFAGDTDVDYREGGRGTNIMRLNPASFDKLVIGFAGIIGDEGEQKHIIDNAAVDFGIAARLEDLSNQRGRATFTDVWGAIGAYINCGFSGYRDGGETFNQVRAQGVLGALTKLHMGNPDLRLALSLGGRHMSQAFHPITKEPESRARLVDSLNHIFGLFPMFNELHIDWMYPEAEDSENLAKLLRELKRSGNLSEAKISVAVSADIEKLKASNIPKLIEAGVGGLNLMAYDFFGTSRTEKLAHHANLKGAPGAKFSADAAVQYLINVLKISPGIISLGCVSYTRNAKGATLTRVSPLEGTCSANTETTVGSFESGMTEWPDILYNYLDLENRTGLNGFELYTDTASDSDFLYNKTSKVFMSLDTPRTVKAKAEYALKHDLAGVFLWNGDGDNGLLTNAAREGLGAEPENQVIDMKEFYFTGKTSL